MDKKLNFSKMFMDMHPGFFEKEYIKNIGDSREYKELILWASDIEKTNIPIEVPDNITFGMYEGDFEAFLFEVRRVDTGWAEIYKPGDRIYCGFDGEKIASFCMLEDMGTYTEDGVTYKIGGPGCVGTVPEYRKKGIGLKMIQKATAIIKDLGYDISYIHYTGVANWYAKLGYEVVLTWNKHGITGIN